MPTSPDLSTVIRDPAALAALSPRAWESVLARGRRHGISGRWHGELDALGLLEHVPQPVVAHLGSDRLVAAEHARMARWEANRLVRAFRDTDLPVVLLKGGAYLQENLPPGRARLVSDLDILIPEAGLAEAERVLTANGWQCTVEHAYDDRYFRRWMHELPPFRHTLRGTVVDVHHNLLPRTCRLCPDAALLIARAVPSTAPRLRVLHPVDMVIHSILHGFYNGEFTNCLRDVLDVHELVTHWADHHPGFWAEFADRTAEMGIERPVHYGLRYAARLLGTAVPPDIGARAAPGRVAARLMDFAVEATFLPALAPTLRERLAFRLLQIRAHWIKMPPRLLAGHLARKLARRIAADRSGGDSVA